MESPSLAREPMHHATQPAAPSGSGRGALWVAILAILFTALAVWILDDRMFELRQREKDFAATLERLEARGNGVERAQRAQSDAAAETQREVGARLDQQRARLENAQAEVRSLREQFQSQNMTVKEIQEQLAMLNARLTMPNIELEKRLSDLSQRIAKSEDDRHALQTRLAEVEAQPQVAAPAAEAPGAPTDAAATAQPAWHALVTDLGSKDDTTRWQAVTSLAGTKDPEVVVHLVPMLRDANLFVRIATARGLERLQAKSAVPALIEALEDAETAVREAAYQTLRAITGKDVKFDPTANEVDRKKRVAALREWWKKESESGA